MLTAAPCTLSMQHCTTFHTSNALFTRPDLIFLKWVWFTAIYGVSFGSEFISHSCITSMNWSVRMAWHSGRSVEYYLNTVLCNMLLPDIRRVSGDWQDSALAHRARAAVEERKTQKFISPLLWPPNSPDLNLQCVEHTARKGVQCTKHASLISTTSNIASEPNGPCWITQSLLQLCASGVIQLSSYTSSCVGAGGGHFEHCFWFWHCVLR